MNNIDFYIRLFLGVLAIGTVADIVQGYFFYKAGKERTHQLFLSNEIRRQTYIEKYKPQMRVTPPPTQQQEINMTADELRKGKGVKAFFGRRT